MFSSRGLARALIGGKESVLAEPEAVRLVLRLLHWRGKYKDTDTVYSHWGFNLWFGRYVCMLLQFHCNVPVDFDMLRFTVLSGTYFFFFLSFFFSS